MMKKFFSKYFLIAAMVAAVGCISSCKDYNDEMNAKIDGIDATLQKMIEDHRAAIDVELTKLDNERKALRKSLEEYMGKAEELYATKTDLETKIAELKAELKCDCPIEQPNTGCDCANNTELQELLKWYKENNEAIDKAVADVNTVVTDLGELNERLEDYEEQKNNIVNLSTLVGNLQKQLDGKVTDDELEGVKTVLTTLIETSNNSVRTELTNYVTEELNIDDELSILGSMNKTLNGNIAKLDTAINLRVDTLIRTEVVEYITTVIADTANTEFKDYLIDQLVSETEKKIDSINSSMSAELAVVVGNLENLYEKVETYQELAQQYTDDAIAALKDYVVPAIGGLEALLSEVHIDLSNLSDEVAELKKQVDSEIARLNKITDQLRNDVDNLEDALEQRISSVNIQGAYSPVIGYFNIPMGVKSNIVAAYYGEFATGETEINFPFVYSSSMLDGSLNALNDLKASLGYEGETIDELSDGKAGKIYMTINPTEVDLTNVEFALVNSLGENAPVELTVQPSEDKLSFGYTRAGGATLYEALATIKDTEATEFSLKESDYKDIFSDLKDGGDIDLSAIAEVLYGTFNEIADANAVSAAWTDAMGHSHTVLSNYDIAAVSVQPLSFAFMQDVTVETVPGYETAKDIIDEMIEELNEDVSFSKFENLKSGLYKYLDKLNDRLSGVINSVNAKLQPVLLISEDKDFKLLGQSESRPVEVASEITLVPTTYTAELLAPAFKKYVAITAVNGYTDNLAAVNAAAGEDLNKVLDGDVREITFKGESGNTYEITYSALDYAGFVVNTKYYVTVK